MRDRERERRSESPRHSHIATRNKHYPAIAKYKLLCNADNLGSIKKATTPLSQKTILMQTIRPQIYVLPREPGIVYFIYVLRLLNVVYQQFSLLFFSFFSLLFLLLLLLALVSDMIYIFAMFLLYRFDSINMVTTPSASFRTTKQSWILAAIQIDHKNKFFEIKRQLWSTDMLLVVSDEAIRNSIVKIQKPFDN